MADQSQAAKGLRFRELHAADEIFVMPNPWDAGSARILQALGFQALGTTSAGLAFAQGVPDGAGAVTAEMTLANARAIAAASDLPVSGDLENGYGATPEAVADTIRAAAAAGLVGGSIEDSTGDTANPILDAGLAVERVAAAVEAARALPFPFTVTARSENFLHGRADLDDTIARLQAFERAGADVLYAPGLPGIDAIRRVCQSVGRPVNVVMGLKGQAYALPVLAEAGVRRVSLGGALARAALGGFVEAAREVREKGTFTFADKALAFATANAYMRRG